MKRFPTQLLAIILISTVSLIQIQPTFAYSPDNDGLIQIESESPSPTPTPSAEPEITPTPSPTVKPSPYVPPTESAIASESTATSDSSVSTNASTGSNTTSGTGTTTIISGDAVSIADVITTANVTIINSTADIVLANQNSNANTDADLRDLFNVGSSTTLTATSTHITTSATNTADISNVVVVRANTGDNHATGSDTLISTGDAYATANIINILNTNIIDSNLLLLIFNSFGNWNGDIVLPNATFFENYFQSYLARSNSTSPLIFNTTNDASVSNTTETNAVTGENTTSSDDGLILTGKSFAGTNIINDINQNYIGGTTNANLIFRVFGNWSGTVFNLPTFFTTEDTSFGIQFINTGSTSPSSHLSPLSATFTNSALINNQVSVEANSGKNSAYSSTTTILTGDAYAVANIVNIANTNIIGRNWLNAIINIFGDWTGNISFGQPDLWVGTRAEFIQGKNWPGSKITYIYTIKNNGDSPAHNISLRHVVDSSNPYIGFPESTQKDLDVGTLAPGEQKELSLSGVVLDSVPYGEVPIENTITVTAQESDRNTTDNTDSITVTATRTLPSYVGPAAKDERFSITKTNNSTGEIVASSTVDYTITIRNVGGYAQSAKLTDVITNETNDVIHTEEFDLGEVFADEEVTVTYTVFFNASTTAGKYKNTAQISSYHDKALATSVITISAFTPLVALRSEIVEVTPQKNTQIYRQPIRRASITPSSTEATSTIASAIVKSFTEFKPIPTESSYIASVFGAIRFSWWYWIILLLILGAAYITHRSNKNNQLT